MALTALVFLLLSVFGVQRRLLQWLHLFGVSGRPDVFHFQLAEDDLNALVEVSYKIYAAFWHFSCLAMESLAIDSQSSVPRQ